MLSEKNFKELVKKYQASEINILREYFQHLFLSNLYRLKESEKLAFKGGTALRVIFGSPRFSEDMDFTTTLKLFHLKNLLRKVLSEIEFEGLGIKTLESKPTSGGYIAIYETKIQTSSVRVELNISLRQRHQRTATTAHLVINPFMPSYTVVALRDKLLVKEKIEALLMRQKPRDFFDLYFILRNRLCVDEVIPYQSRLLKTISKQNKRTLVRELKNFLPRIHWNALKDLPEKLAAELNRI